MGLRAEGQIAPTHCFPRPGPWAKCADECPAIPWQVGPLADPGCCRGLSPPTWRAVRALLSPQHCPRGSRSRSLEISAHGFYCIFLSKMNIIYSNISLFPKKKKKFAFMFLCKMLPVFLSIITEKYQRGGEALGACFLFIFLLDL